MRRHPFPRAALSAYLILGSFLMSLSGCEKTPVPIVPQGASSSTIDVVGAAEGLVNGTLSQERYDQLLLSSEEERRAIRRSLLILMSNDEIAARETVFAIVGPPDDASAIADNVVNAAIPEPLWDTSGLSTEAWYLYVPVPFYSQNDGRWSGNGLGFNACGNSTISRHGCHLCCIAMLYAKWGYPQMNPPGLNVWSQWGRAHYAFAAADVPHGNCGNLIRLPQALEYPGVCRPWRYIGVDQIWPELAAGHPVIAQTTQYGGHFVVIFGHNGQRYYVKDPVKDAANQDQPLTGALNFRLYGY